MTENGAEVEQLHLDGIGDLLEIRETLQALRVLCVFIFVLMVSMSSVTLIGGNINLGFAINILLLAGITILLFFWLNRLRKKLEKLHRDLRLRSRSDTVHSNED
jgi:hypothetical protein